MNSVTAAKLAAFGDKLKGKSRIIIVGGPRTGKSTLAVRLGERHDIPVRFGDSLIDTHEWSEASEEVSRWLDEKGPAIIDGVVAARALRKWLARNPEGHPDFTVVFLRDNIQVQSPGARAMAKGVETVWREIEPELRRRGVEIIERDAPRQG